MNNKKDFKKSVPLNGHGTKGYAKKGNPVSDKQKAIIEAIEYYFDVKLSYTNAKTAYDAINKYEDRVKVSYGKKIYIDGHLIHDDGHLVKDAYTVEQHEAEAEDDYYFNLAQNYTESKFKDPMDMSTWDDDDWINFELDH